jgi:hypothetical protein
MEELLQYLLTLPTGPVQAKGQLETLLAAHWSEFQGGEEEGMTGQATWPHGKRSVGSSCAYTRH